MTVRELIDLLSELPEESEIVVLSADGDELEVEAVWLGCDNEDEDLVEYEDEAAAMKEENPDMTDEEVWDELDPVVVLSVS
jgi:hypothetical protein